MRNQLFAYVKTKLQISCAVTTQLINDFVFTTQIKQSLFFLNPKFQASSYILWLHSPDLVRNREDRLSHNEAHMFLSGNINQLKQEYEKDTSEFLNTQDSPKPCTIVSFTTHLIEYYNVQIYLFLSGNINQLKQEYEKDTAEFLKAQDSPKPCILLFFSTHLIKIYYVCFFQATSISLNKNMRKIRQNSSKLRNLTRRGWNRDYRQNFRLDVTRNRLNVGNR